MSIKIHKIESPKLEIDRTRINADKDLLLKAHREVVIAAEELYPGIDIWYDKKVKPGIESGERIGYLITSEDKPVAAAIAKQGENAKICTIRVAEEMVDKKLGAILFLLIAFNLRHETKKVHFTCPEYLWNTYNSFFIGMGFFKSGEAGTQYRLFDPEIVAEADYNLFKSQVFSKYFSKYASYFAQIYDEKIEILLSLKPDYADRILRKTKIMELRRKFSKRWIGCYALIYSSAPEQAIVGMFKIKDVVKEKPIYIWQKWREAIDCNEEEFINYTNDADEIYGILVDDVKSVGPIFLSSLNLHFSEPLSPPQSYLNIRSNKRWESALAISNMKLKNI